MTRNPGPDDWRAGIDKFNTRFTPLHIRPVTDPATFPDCWFLGLAEVIRPASGNTEFTPPPGPQSTR